jgi:energy-coupling factor transporter transmembrane protein EcfT
MENTKPIRFQEIRSFTTWVYGLLLAVIIPSMAGLIVTAAKTPGIRWLVPLDFVLLALTFNLLCQRTNVTEAELIVSFGALFPLYQRRIDLRDMASAVADTYQPIAEYGGWGIRGFGRSVALNARGNHGVRLTLKNGRRVLIGSQRSDDLAAALTAPR